VVREYELGADGRAGGAELDEVDAARDTRAYSVGTIPAREMRAGAADASIDDAHPAAHDVEQLEPNGASDADAVTELHGAVAVLRGGVEPRSQRAGVARNEQGTGDELGAARWREHEAVPVRVTGLGARVVPRHLAFRHACRPDRAI